MRLATLTLVVLASACGSSSPEVAPTPQLAPTSAAAPAAARPSISAREQYYDIDGSSAGALRDQIHRLGPKDESGQAHDALTVWDLEWTYHDAPGPGGCALRDVHVTLTVTITLPRWTPPETAEPTLRASWRSYLEHVKLHEGGHRAIAERNARDLLAALTGLRGATCEELRAEASRTAERMVAEGRARNRAYDVETKHGQTQGVVLGP
jgi:predicted secreted Zn-dependent protease